MKYQGLTRPARKVNELVTDCLHKDMINVKYKLHHHQTSSSYLLNIVRHWDLSGFSKADGTKIDNISLWRELADLQDKIITKPTTDGHELSGVKLLWWFVMPEKNDESKQALFDWNDARIKLETLKIIWKYESASVGQDGWKAFHNLRGQRNAKQGPDF